MESVYKPVLIRGTDGELNFNFFLYNFFHLHFFYDFIMGVDKKGSRPYTTGEMNSAQFGAIVGQVNLAHQPPMVRFFFIIYLFF